MVKRKGSRPAASGWPLDRRPGGSRKQRSKTSSAAGRSGARGLSAGHRASLCRNSGCVLHGPTGACARSGRLASGVLESMCERRALAIRCWAVPQGRRGVASADGENGCPLSHMFCLGCVERVSPRVPGLPCLVLGFVLGFALGLSCAFSGTSIVGLCLFVLQDENRKARPVLRSHRNHASFVMARFVIRCAAGLARV